MSAEERLREQGVLLLSGTIDRSTVHPLVAAILGAQGERPRDGITLYIDSPGGDCEAGFALIDLMRWSPVPIATVGLGMVGSMALLVLMAGRPGTRRIMPSASLLSHRFQSMTAGTHADLVAARVQQDLVHRRIVDHYRRCTRLQEDATIEAELLRPTDRWLTPAEAVSYGMVDRIVAMSGEAHHG